MSTSRPLEQDKPTLTFHAVKRGVEVVLYPHDIYTSRILGKRLWATFDTLQRLVKFGFRLTIYGDIQPAATMLISEGATNLRLAS